jgi:hypothetical protein
MCDLIHRAVFWAHWTISVPCCNMQSCSLLILHLLAHHPRNSVSSGGLCETPIFAHLYLLIPIIFICCVLSLLAYHQ